jgi:hypothetical protein
MIRALSNSNDDSFWVSDSSPPGAYYHEEEMALITADKKTASDEYKSSSSGINSQTAIVKWRKSRSYNFNEVATNLQNTAERAVQEANVSDNGYKRNSVSRCVARIVLDESNKIVDTSEEYITGVVRQVARYAQHGGDDDETSYLAANQVTQPKGTTSLGTMVSFFVIWCVSLCASHIDSKDMPPPVLKLAAEEVASVLQSN